MSPFTDKSVKRPFSTTPGPAGARTTSPLDSADGSPQNTRATRPLGNAGDWCADAPTVPMQRQTHSLNPRQTPVPSTSLGGLKPRIVIPAEKKRAPGSLKQRRGSRILIGVLLGSILILALTSVFVAPLGTSQHAQNIVQSVSDWFSSGQIGAITTSQIPVVPTSTPALMTNDGYCGGHDIWGTCATAVTASGVMGTGQMQRPILGAVITQPFAHPEYQFWCGCWKPHTGIDLAAPYGTAIMAADSGQVIWTGWDWSGLGWAVKINHGNYIATIYGHMERYIVSVGQNVTKGQVIGYEGSTGASTGPHVHFMVLINNIWVNPALYMQLP
jgi:Peptidase family M23